MTAAAAVIMRREKDLVEQFRQAHALTPETAQSLSSVGGSEGIAFRRLRSREILREASAGRFYLDELSWGAFNRARDRLLMILLVLALLLLVGGIFGMWGK